MNFIFLKALILRPDLAYAVSLVSRFMGNPGKIHWEALKWILRYLKGTETTCLIYKVGSRGADPVIGYVDSDFAGSIDTRKSLTGYIYVAWYCYKLESKFTSCGFFFDN